MPPDGFEVPDLGMKLVSSLGTGGYAPVEEQPLAVSDTTGEYVGISKGEKKILSSHDEVKEILVEIGRMQGYVVESEYPCDGGRLDVVWRKHE